MEKRKPGKFIICILIFALFISVIAGCIAQTADVISEGQSPNASTSSPIPSSSPDTTEKPFVQGGKQAEPLFYDDGGKLYIARGASAVCLGNTDDIYNYNGWLNGVLSGDKKRLYYIAYGGKMKSAGDLYKVEAGYEPLKVAEGVCAAQPSYDGNKVLYITDIGDISGTLYYKDGGNAPEEIAQGVIPADYGFSPNGQYFYYIVQEKNVSSIYIKNAKSAPALVVRVNETPDIDIVVNAYAIRYIGADDQGRLLYNACTGDDEKYPICLYTQDGMTETICEDGSIIRTLGSVDELLFREYDPNSGFNTLKYKLPGQESVNCWITSTV